MALRRSFSKLSIRRRRLSGDVYEKKNLKTIRMRWQRLAKSDNNFDGKSDKLILRRICQHQGFSDLGSSAAWWVKLLAMGACRKLI
jgi:hypothetical protein